MKIKELLARTRRVLEPEAMDDAFDACVYDRVAKAHAFLDAMFLRHILRNGKERLEKGIVLDVGCGSGRLSLLLMRNVPQVKVVGVDISDPMLRLACANARSRFPDRMILVKGDGKGLPFPDETFDVVICYHTLHHIPDPEGLIREMQRVLRAGGKMFVRDVRRPDRLGVIELSLATAGHIYDCLGRDAGIAKSLYRASLHAGLSSSEWRDVARRCGIPERCTSTQWLWNHLDITWQKPADN